jgi:hypothetical protein
MQEGNYKILDLNGEMIGEFSVDEFGELYSQSPDLKEMTGDVTIEDIEHMFMHSPYFKVLRVS